MDARNAGAVLPESVTKLSGWSRTGAAGGASSKTKKALVPPSPSELTAATRGRSAGQFLHSVLTKNGLLAKSILRLGVRKLRLAGIFPSLTARAALISAAIPAACSRCPILVLTEVIAQKPRRSVPFRKARVNASISNGSPTTVPVPWHST